VGFRGLSFGTASLWTKVMTKITDGTIDIPEIPPLMIFNFYGAVFFFSMAGSNTTSIFLADRLLCGVFYIIPFVSAFRNFLKREQKREQLRSSQNESTSQKASRSQRISVSQITSLSNRDQVVAVDTDDNNILPPLRITDETTRDVITPHDEESVNTNIDTSVIDHKVTILEMRKHFTENKIFALITPVSCTFMIIVSFELAMSMYLYHRDGVPANWCEPFTFRAVDKGFQIVLDYFL
jgi:hypothetical protein